MGMTRLSAFVAGSGLSVLLLAAAGCGTNIPPKLEVRDPNSGRSYQTYQSWGQVEKGVGYGFTDIETGSRITLTNYEIRTIEPEYVDGGLPFGCATCDHAFVIKYEVFVRIIRTRIDE